ncbi:hypothetical protein BDV28DRAFT_77310 [Aspergillus coremiiformis]|uniref:FAS1 domain-containing protein n=1 Tax=Aspergillus coremiiformis TaxID=138285 RepID=A0A5N6YTR2_9EURO|nr:hypothetical protein BDV28DRAFT_77310 [Aspergillus coremiiformis]
MQFLPKNALHTLYLLLSILFLNSLVYANPVNIDTPKSDVPNAPASPPPPPPGSPRPSIARRFPSETEIRKAMVVPPPDRAVFFSRMVNDAAMQSLTTKGYKNFTEVFPIIKPFLNIGLETDPEFQTLADVSSKMMAENAAGEVHVIFGDDVPPCTTWNRIEYPALQVNAKVTQVVAVKDSDVEQRRVIWKKGQTLNVARTVPSNLKTCLNWFPARKKNRKPLSAGNRGVGL